MPILWRYLLKHYLKVLFFCTAAFIAILFTMRLDEIARFITLGAGGLHLLFFSLYQIPYILPIALPISCLISTVLLIQNLSKTHELTALRASAISIRNILTPILLAASILSIVNFYIVSEIATSSHLASGMLKTELRSLNPLLVLNNKHLMRLKGYHFDILGNSHKGEMANDIFLAIPNKKNDRLTLLIAKNLETDGLDFKGKQITLLSSFSEEEEQFDNIFIENIATAATSVEDFAQMIQKKVWSVNNDHLKLSLLLVRLHEGKQELQAAKPAVQKKQIKRSLQRSQSEIVRRISLALAVISFSILGIAFGMSISRNPSHKRIFIVIILAAFYLISYFAAKALDHQFILAATLYLLPHLLIILISLLALHRISKGIE